MKKTFNFLLVRPYNQVKGTDNPDQSNNNVIMPNNNNANNNSNLFPIFPDEDFAFFAPNQENSGICWWVDNSVFETFEILLCDFVRSNGFRYRFQRFDLLL